MTAYLAPKDKENLLLGELKGVKIEHFGRLFLTKKPPQKAFWAQNIWFEPEIIPITSISDAVKKLRIIQKYWSYYPHNCHRRATLIEEQLPVLPATNIKFPSPLPQHPIGSWTLLDENTLLASAKCSSPFPQGEIHFEEDKINPPSRAYLKLWEVFTLLQTYPSPKEICLEIGAAPGSWSWVLEKLCSKVICIDKAYLEVKSPKICFLKGDAFALKPQDFPEVSWIFSDVICYPEKLFEWVQKWRQVNPNLNFICTLKFQRDEHYRAIDAFASIEGSKLLHLFNNKHELTWVLLKETLL